MLYGRAGFHLLGLSRPRYELEEAGAWSLGLRWASASARAGLTGIFRCAPERVKSETTGPGTSLWVNAVPKDLDRSGDVLKRTATREGPGLATGLRVLLLVLRWLVGGAGLWLLVERPGANGSGLMLPVSWSY